MTKIIIAGIGAVGGYFGGLMAKQFFDSSEVAINFLARGEHLTQIRTKGLKVIKGDSEFIARPALATDDPAEMGIADFIIICTKSYDLENIIQQLKPCINKGTVILPLLNGVDHGQRIKKILPGNIILDGCVYIVSRLKQAGVIENSGNIEKLHFGQDGPANEKLVLLENLFKQSGIDASLSANISTIIWEKFIFISPVATATSFFDNCIGELLQDEQKISTVSSLAEEVRQLSNAKKIAVAEDMVEKVLNRIRSLPFDTTSSMHSDFRDHKHTELESLTGYVISEGKKYHISTPTYDRIYPELKKKNN